MDTLGDVAALVLISLADAPRHGGAIIEDVKATAGRTLAVGTLYGTLDRLIGDGLVEAAPAEGRRRPYRITTAGAEALAGHLRAMGAALAAGERRLAARGGLLGGSPA